jgi:hypothetical protein
MLAKKNQSPGFVRWLIQSWWMGVVLFVTFGLYFQGMSRKGAIEARMLSDAGRLSTEITRVKQERRQLECELASVSDPEWIELVLMRKLGVVPEGQTKVYFK